VKNIKLAILIALAGTLLTINTETLARLQTSFHEDFSSTQYRDDTWTTADWDTVLGAVHLPAFEITEIGFYDTPGEAQDVVLFEEYAFVADGSAGLAVLDISDRSNPTPVAGYDPPGSVDHLVVSYPYAYLTAGINGLVAMDIFDPEAPVVLDSYPLFMKTATDVIVSGNRAYLGTSDGSLVVLDITDPSNLLWAGSLTLSGAIEGLEIAGDVLYVAAGVSGLHLVDIEDPSAPTLLSSYGTSGQCSAIALHGDQAVVADGSAGLLVLDVSRPMEPTLIGAYNTPGTAVGITLSGPFVYVADDSRGVHLFSLATATPPEYIMNFESTGQAQALAVAGEYGFLADGGAGLRILDVANDAIGDPATHLLWGLEPEEVVVAGPYAYVAHGSQFRIVDVSNPGLMAEVGSSSDPQQAVSVAVAGDHAYVLDQGPEALLVFGVNRPELPTLVASTPIPLAQDIEISGDHAFIASADSGLVVMDISNPALPVRVWEDAFCGADQMTVCGNWLVLVGVNEEICLYDISDPAVPIQKSRSLSTGFSYSQVVAEGDFIFTATPDGVRVGERGAMSIVWQLTPYHPFSASLECTGVAVENSSLVSFWGQDGFTSRCARTDISDLDDFQLMRSCDVQAALENPVISGDYVFGVKEYTGLVAYQLFDRVVRPELNEARSIPPNDYRDRVVWINAEGTGRSYQLFVGNDIPEQNWVPVPYDGNGVFMPSWGPVPLWKCKLASTPQYGPGELTSVDLEWKYDFALIESIVDVPEDQGGWVRVHFSPSGFDTPVDDRPHGIDDYFVFARIDDPVLASRVGAQGHSATGPGIAPEGVAARPTRDVPTAGNLDLRVLDDRTFIVSGDRGEFPPGVWEVVGSCPAFVQEDYVCRVPTTRDSTAVHDGNTVFCIFAQESYPGTNFHVSPPDSGCSVDNIAPGVPTGLWATYDAAGVSLDWDDAPDDDFQYYRIYRGTDPSFTPTPSHLVMETAVSSWTDPLADPWGYHYKVSTLDHAGNESDTEGPQGLSGAQDNEIPTRTMLLGATPNPFNPSTRISYDLAGAGNVRIKIFDVTGRLVRTLVDEQREPGRYERIWDGRDDKGTRVSSGVYLYRLEAGTYVGVKRLVLIK
jgi:hypothetical protein